MHERNLLIAMIVGTFIPMANPMIPLGETLKKREVVERVTGQQITTQILSFLFRLFS